MKGKLRIAMVVERYPVATETFIQAQVEGLAVHTVVLSGPPEATLPATAEQHVFRLSSAPRLAVFAQRAGERLRRVVEGRYPVFRPTHGQRRALRAHLKQLQPDVVLAQFGNVGLEVARSCRGLGLPLVVHFHGIDASRMLRSARYRKGLSRIFQRGAAAITNCQAHADRLAQLLPEPLPKPYVIPYGIVSAKPRGPIKSIQHWVCLGRLVEKKRPLLTVQAFALLQQQHPQATLTFIGEGPLRAEVEATIAAYGLEQHVKVLGHLPHAIAMRKLLEYDAYVQPCAPAANGDDEGGPLSIAEAGMRGLPVVITAHGGVATYVQHGISGLVVPEQDVKATASAMLQYTANPLKAQEMAHAFRATLCTQFVRSTQLEKLYACLAQEAKRQHSGL